jgi:hypothetical protein
LCLALISDKRKKAEQLCSYSEMLFVDSAWATAASRPICKLPPSGLFYHLKMISVLKLNRSIVQNADLGAIKSLPQMAHSIPNIWLLQKIIAFNWDII